ncbi:MAG: glycosyltransferase family 4 protein [Thermofilum sp.]|nr:glycosyltransferase family 4 protein [Thermofilum sp.]
MKIVYVHHHYWPVVGGLENVVKALAEGMAKLGHEVHVITSTHGAQGRPRKEKVNGVHIHRVRSIRLGYPDLTRPLEYPTDVLKNADVVHGHSQNSLFTAKTAEKAKELGATTVIHFIAVNALNDHPTPWVRFLGPFYASYMVRKAIELADLRLVKSFRDLEILRSRYGVEAHYIPDGVGEEIVNAPNMAQEFREKYGIQEPFVVYVGRLHKLKGVDVLIKAVSIAVKEYPKLKAVIIGPGDQKPYRELAQRLGVKDNVVFLGYVDEKTKIGALDASIALVLPSICNYVEVFSIVISEAWARNKPAIASAVGEIPYRVTHMVNGLLVTPRNPKALAEAISLLANDKELSRKLGSEGRKNVSTWDEIVSKLIKIYTTG